MFFVPLTRWVVLIMGLGLALEQRQDTTRATTSQISLKLLHDTTFSHLPTIPLYNRLVYSWWMICPFLQLLLSIRKFLYSATLSEGIPSLLIPK